MLFFYSEKEHRHLRIQNLASAINHAIQTKKAKTSAQLNLNITAFAEELRAANQGGQNVKAIRDALQNFLKPVIEKVSLEDQLTRDDIDQGFKNEEYYENHLKNTENRRVTLTNIFKPIGVATPAIIFTAVLILAYILTVPLADQRYVVIPALVGTLIGIVIYFVTIAVLTDMKLIKRNEKPLITVNEIAITAAKLDQLLSGLDMPVDSKQTENKNIIGTAPIAILVAAVQPDDEEKEEEEEEGRAIMHGYGS